MKKFCILEHPTLGFRAVKIGFSWPGFFLLGVWMIYHKLWLHLLGLVVVNLCIAAFQISEEISMIVQFAIMLFIGYNGNRWLVMKWLKKGYEAKGLVFATSKEHAITKFVKEPDQKENHSLLNELVGRGI